MSCTEIVHDGRYSRNSGILRRRNLYHDEPTATLAAEAQRIAGNRRLIVGDLRRDPASWHGGWGNVDVLDVLFADAVGAMLVQPALIGGAL